MTLVDGGRGSGGGRQTAATADPDLDEEVDLDLDLDEEVDHEPGVDGGGSGPTVDGDDVDVDRDPVDADGGARSPARSITRRSRRWHRVRQVAGVAALAAVVAVPVRLQASLADERDRLAAAEQQAAGARTAQVGAEAEVAERTLRVADAEVEAVAAARLARAARSRLAASGVSEAALFETLDLTEREILGVERLRAAVAADVARQDQLLPDARRCIDEANQALGRSAIAAATGRGSVTGSTPACTSMGDGGGPR